MRRSAAGATRPVTAGLAAAALVVVVLTGCSSTTGSGTTGSGTPGSSTAGSPGALPLSSARSTPRASVTAAQGGSPRTGAGPLTATPSAAQVKPPYVASVRWVTGASGRSLQVRPTSAGRTTEAPYDEAWSEVLRLAPGADTPGMQAQLACHWTFARLLAPDKPSWNLEPWRPVVSTDAMLAAGCNPGGAED